MHFLLSSMSVVYVLTTPFPEDGGDDTTVEQIRKRAKWNNDDHVYRELLDSLEAKYMAENASSKKFLVSNFTNYKMTNSRPVLEQYNELLGIRRRFTQHKMNMDKSIHVSCIIDKLPSSWKDFKHTLKHLKEELTLVELGIHLRIEESLRMQDSDKPKGNNVASPSVVNMVEHKKSSRDCKGGKASNKANGSGTNGSVDGSTNSLKVVRLPDPKLKTLGERGIKCIFVGYVEHSKTLRLSSVPRPSLRIQNGTEDINGSVVLEEVTEEVVQQPKHELRKSKRNRTPKNFGPEFQLYLIEGTRDEGFNQKSRIDYFDTYAPVARINTIRLLIVMASIYNLSIHQMDVKTTFLNGELDEEVYINQPQGFIMPGNENKVDLTKEFLSSKFSMNDMGKADVILVSTPMDTNEKLMPNNGQAVSQLKYSRVIGCLIYAMTCTRPDITFVMAKLSSGWVFLLGGGVISWASKKQTCITGSTIEFEFVALAAVGKEAEWLKNLLLEIPLWFKHIALISIRYDSAATLAKAYSQMYNGKSRHLDVRHNMIHKLIMNGVVSIEFVRSQQNLVDHLMKGLARDLVLKSAEGMCLKSNQVAKC
ncbi:zinc finger, CCHC-type containing protein [Tanacetum coccineum]